MRTGNKMAIFTPFFYVLNGLKIALKGLLFDYFYCFFYGKNVFCLWGNGKGNTF